MCVWLVGAGVCDSCSRVASPLFHCLFTRGVRGATDSVHADAFCTCMLFSGCAVTWCGCASGSLLPRPSRQCTFEMRGKIQVCCSAMICSLQPCSTNTAAAETPCNMRRTHLLLAFCAASCIVFLASACAKADIGGSSRCVCACLCVRSLLHSLCVLCLAHVCVASDWVCKQSSVAK